MCHFGSGHACSSVINQKLSEPAMYEKYISVDESGIPREVAKAPNPNYVYGTSRQVLEFLHDALPSGQAIQLVGVFDLEELEANAEFSYAAERLVYSYQDKTMRKLAERLNIELRKLRKERHRFQQGDLELKNAITNISHDLRTPLTAIGGYLDLLDSTEKNEVVERYIDVIRNWTEALKQLTEELFTYSVIKSPDYDNRLEPVAINAVLEESIIGFYSALQERKIKPNIVMTENKIIRKANRTALSRIFSNLMNNALKYSDGDLDIMLADTGEIIFSNSPSQYFRRVTRKKLMLFCDLKIAEVISLKSGLGYPGENFIPVIESIIYVF